MDNQNMPQPEHHSGNILLMVIVIVLLLTNLFTIYWLSKNQTKTNDTNTNTYVNDIVDLNQNSNTNTAVEIIDSVPPGDTVNITVDWSSWPTARSQYDFFGVDLQRVDGLLESANNSGSYLFEGTVYDYLTATEFYKIGTVSSGDYDGDDVYIINFPANGPRFGNGSLRVIRDGTKYIIIARQSYQYIDSGLKTVFTVDPNLYITNLETPDSIKIPNIKFPLVKDKSEPLVFLSNYDNPILAFTVGDYKIYRDDLKDCFIVEAGDGTVREYLFDMDFAPLSDSESGPYSFYSQLIKFNFSDGTANTQAYTYQRAGGCGGAFSCYNFADYITNANQLKEVGRSSSGEIFYELADVNTKARPEETKTVLESIYDMYYPGFDEVKKEALPKMSMEDFIADHPLLFWKEPSGKYVTFTNVKYLPAAECGKPVIYLYPTKTTDVSVKVSPTGGLSITEPDYGNGWFVKADPSGAIFNYNDQKEYPYLFWEGYAMNYQIADEGFVVAKSNVESFLNDKLAEQGLNDTEIADFIEFWLPRMQSAEYYFVTFMPQAEFDRLAPLEINPKADTIIRVFMDYKPLEKPIEVKEQIFEKPERIGFTAVEWGGALHN